LRYLRKCELLRFGEDIAMPNTTDILWFKTAFASRIKTGVQGTAFTVDMLTAIACQETGYIWASLRKQGLAVADILRLCVGDTIDAKPGGGGRRAFPKNKAELLAHDHGAAMFAAARAVLVELAHYMPSSFGGAAANPVKFPRGYGMFQYDLQYFDKDQAYFLTAGYAEFDKTLAKCIGELKEAAKIAKVQNKPTLTDAEMAAVAIAYNSGSYDPAKGLKQGYKDSDGVYYGEHIAQYLKAAHAIPDPAPATGAEMVVHVASTLNVRSAPDKAGNNIVATLVDGIHVHALSTVPTQGFLEIESGSGAARVHGYAWSAYLAPA
jgi:hypothetical protein